MLLLYVVTLRLVYRLGTADPNTSKYMITCVSRSIPANWDPAILWDEQARLSTRNSAVEMSGKKVDYTYRPVDINMDSTLYIQDGSWGKLRLWCLSDLKQIEWAVLAGNDSCYWEVVQSGLALKLKTSPVEFQAAFTSISSRLGRGINSKSSTVRFCCPPFWPVPFHARMSGDKYATATVSDANVLHHVPWWQKKRGSPEVAGSPLRWFEHWTPVSPWCWEDPRYCLI